MKCEFRLRVNLSYKSLLADFLTVIELMKTNRFLERW